MLITNKIEINVQGPNIKYYIDKGYNNIKVGDIIIIDIKDLPIGSHTKVEVMCDCCGIIKNTFYFAYNKYIKDSNYFCNKCNIQIRNKTNLEKYGVEFVLNNCDIKQKSNKTNLEKYNNIIPQKSDIFKEKMRKSIKEKYDCDYILQNKEIRNKINDTNIKKYGNKCCLLNVNIKNKSKRTNIEKYGYEHSLQNEQIYEKCKIKSSITKKNKIIQKYNILKIDYDKNEFLCKCDICNNDYIISPHNFYQRIKYNTFSCTICNSIDFSISGLEKLLINFIKENYTDKILLNDRKVLRGKELDIYLPELKLAFEFNGLY